MAGAAEPESGEEHLRREFARRWPRWAARLRADLAAGEPPIYAGAPVLIPGFEVLLAEGHREVGRDDAAALRVQGDQVDGFLVGHPVQLSGVAGLTPPLLVAPSAGGVRCEGADGKTREVDLQAEVCGLQIEGAELFRRLQVEPPLLLTATRFPEFRSVTVYELATFYLPALRGFTAMTRSGAAESTELVEQQVDYLRFLLSLLPRGGDAVCVDVGTGSGWLAGALGRAGAAEVFGFDLRVASVGAFYELYPEADRSLLALGDMFDWPLGADCVDLIMIRNNSAFAFAKELGGPFTEMFRACRASLRPGGLIYLTYLSNCSGVEEAAFTNLGLREILAGLKGTGLDVVKIMRQGTGFGLLFAADPDLARIGREVVGQRIAARDQYFADEGEDHDVLHNWLVCLTDVAAEIGLAAVKQGRSKVLLRGDELMVAQMRVLLYEWYQVFCLVVEEAPAGDGDVLVVDLGGRLGGDDGEASDLRPFAARGADRRAAEYRRPWQFASLSGDQDRPISRVLAARMPGRLRCLAIGSELPAAEPEPAPRLSLLQRWRRRLVRSRLRT